MERELKVLNSKVIAHSRSWLGLEAITYELTIPKWLVAELNTHKVEIERNSASSRAIPVNTMISMVISDPFEPDEWYYSHSGMVADEPMTPEDATYAREQWLGARDDMVKRANNLLHLPSGRSAEKLVNRLLEAFLWTKVVVTFTLSGGIGFNNFMGLRDSKAAQKEFRVVAHMMHEQYHTSVPIKRDIHMPYVDYNTIYQSVIPYRGKGMFKDVNWEHLTEMVSVSELILLAMVVSAAHCGRVTYMKQDAEYTIAQQLERGLKFFQDKHFSPLRHPLIAGDAKWYGNQFGWIPVSKLLAPNFKDYVQQCCERAV